jgi:hypothetical protein
LSEDEEKELLIRQQDFYVKYGVSPEHANWVASGYIPPLGGGYEHREHSVGPREAHVAQEVELAALTQVGPSMALLDSAASSHFFLQGDHSMLSERSDIRPDPTTRVVTAGAKAAGLSSTGRVDGSLHVRDGSPALKLKNVALLDAEQLRQRLLSVGGLTGEGYVVVFAAKHCYVIDADGEVVTVIERKGNLYPLDLSKLARRAPEETGAAAVDLPPLQAEIVKRALAIVARESRKNPRPPPASAAMPMESACLARVYCDTANFKLALHRRFGHVSLLGETSPIYKECAKLYGSKFTDCPPYHCSDCYITKAHSLPHPRNSKEKRQRLAGDGPHGRIFIDSFSWPFPGEKGERYGTIMYNERLLTGFAHRLKSDSPKMIISQLKKLLKRQDIGPLSVGPMRTYSVLENEDLDPKSTAWDTVKVMVTDGAAEFMGEELTTFCDQAGIEKQASCPQTQSQNQAENAVKIVTQGIAVLQHQAGTSKKRWTRAFVTVMVTHEVLPSTAPLAGYATPYEALHQVHLPWKVLIRDLHPYGCRVYILIPREVRSHTHGVDKAVAGIFLGYSTTKMGYVVLTDTGVILDGVHNVFFKESSFPKAEARTAARRDNASRDNTITSAEAGAVQTWMVETGAVPTMQDAGSGAQGGRQGTGTVTPSPENSTSTDITETSVLPDIDVTKTLDTDAKHDIEPISDSEPSTPTRNDVPPLEPLTTTKDSDTRVRDDGPSGPLLQAFVRATRPEAQSPQPPVGPLTPQFTRRSSRRKQMSNKMIESLAEGPPQPPDSTPSTSTETKVTECEPSVEEHEKALAAAEDKANTAPSRIKAVAMDNRELKDKCERAMASLVMFEADLKRAPSNRRNALSRRDRDRWVGRGPTSAESKHIAKLQRLGVFRYEVPEAGDNVMRGLWVYALKERAHSGGEMESSARYTGDGGTQVPGVDHGVTHCPTSSPTSFLIDEARAAQDASIIREIWDCIGAYYMTVPAYKQFVRPPPGYEKYDEQGRPMMWRLLRCLPGTKDAGNQFNAQFTEWLVKMAKLRVNVTDASTFHRKDKYGWINLKVHVDDAAVHGQPQSLIDEVYTIIDRRFPLKRRADINLLLGVTIERTLAGISFHQPELIMDVWEMANLKKGAAPTSPFPVSFEGFQSEDLCKDVVRREALDVYPYSQLVGKLGYIGAWSRPDIMYQVAVLRRFPASFGPRMLDMLEHLIKYIFHTKKKGMLFRKGYEHPQTLVAFVDASYACCRITRSSHGCWVIFVLGCPVLWASKRMAIVALSTMEAEFNAAFQLVKELAFVEQLVPDFGFECAKPYPVMEDNMSACYLSQKPNLQGRRTRHMDVRFHYVQDKVMSGLVELKHLDTAWQVADIGTKNVDRAISEKLGGFLMGDVPLMCPVIAAAVEAPSTMLKPKAPMPELMVPIERACMLSEVADDVQPGEERIMGNLTVRSVMSQLLPHLEESDPAYVHACTAVKRASQVALEGLTSALSAISLSYDSSLPIKTEGAGPRAILNAPGGGSGGGVCKLENREDIASALIERKNSDESKSPGTREGFGLSCVHPDRKAWSVPNTKLMVEHQSPRLPAKEEWVGVTSGTGTKMHHVKCHYLYCKHGALAHVAFHGGVRIGTMSDALTAGYAQGECCRRMWGRD